MLFGDVVGGVQVHLWERCVHCIQGSQRTDVRLKMMTQGVEAGGGGVCVCGAGRHLVRASWGRGGAGRLGGGVGEIEAVVERSARLAWVAKRRGEGP